VSIPLHELVSVKSVEQRGADVLEVKRTSAGGQSTTLQLLTNEVCRPFSARVFNLFPCLDPN